MVQLPIEDFIDVLPDENVALPLSGRDAEVKALPSSTS